MSILGIEITAPIAYFEEEKKAFNHFSIDLIMDTDLTRSARSGKLEDSIDYTDVFGTVKRVAESQYDLIEVFLDRLGTALMESFDGIERLHLSITKKAPQLGGKLQSVVLERFWSRETA